MLPFHPTVVHLPIVVSFLLPVLVLAFAFMIKTNKMAPVSWLIIVGLQAFVTGTGYIALESGEAEEHAVEKVVAKKLISAHEEAAEIYVGSTVLALVLGIAAFFIRKEFQFHLQMTIAVASLMSCYLAYKTSVLGGDLVYKHGAASAYKTEPGAPAPEGLLPTPGKNTSESPFPVDEDENEYSHEEDEVKDED
ncbi:MAG TPA: DUF2231 domain-containing protein [Bacteriovoracaceae bacterium]|nr:DUF2231 domain-containing protein [Bacteriovoracaceae bacterium]